MNPAKTCRVGRFSASGHNGWGNRGRSRRVRTDAWSGAHRRPWAAVTAALIGTFAFIILRVNRAADVAAFFTDLSVEDSAAIVKDLERQAISLRDQE